MPAGPNRNSCSWKSIFIPMKQNFPAGVIFFKKHDFRQNTEYKQYINICFFRGGYCKPLQLCTPIQKQQFRIYPDMDYPHWTSARIQPLDTDQYVAGLAAVDSTCATQRKSKQFLNIIRIFGPYQQTELIDNETIQLWRDHRAQGYEPVSSSTTWKNVSEMSTWPLFG